MHNRRRMKNPLFFRNFELKYVNRLLKKCSKKLNNFRYVQNMAFSEHPVTDCIHWQELKIECKS